MAGIYIPGLKLNPGKAISLVVCSSGRTYTDGLVELDQRAIEVPDHGKLIDADEFRKEKRRHLCSNCDKRRGMKDGKPTERFAYAIGGAPCRACGVDDMLGYIEDAPTIIPADKEDTDT